MEKYAFSKRFSATRSSLKTTKLCAPCVRSKQQMVGASPSGELPDCLLFDYVKRSASCLHDRRSHRTAHCRRGFAGEESSERICRFTYVFGCNNAK